MKIKYPSADPHAFSVAEILPAFQTDPITGISQCEAEKRLKEFGPNVYESKQQKSIIRMVVQQFKNPIVYLLLFATAVTLYFQHFLEAISILIVIIINALIGFLMELQARKSMKALKEMDVILSKVVRDGKVQEVPSETIVPGDIILLEGGDVIPGDARLIEANELQCDESSLTGESIPIEKNTEKLAKETTPGDRRNMVFKGSSVSNGNGKAVIIGIGRNTQFGIITTLVESSEEKETPLDKQIRLLSKKLIWITLCLTVIFAITGIIQGKSWLLILETSIALAVAAFPEGLPIVATVALSYGMLLMARRNAIVKNLSAVETLGGTSVILTDKTGTLTENKVTVDTISFYEETFQVSIKDNTISFEKRNIGKYETAFQKLRLVGALCNNAYTHNEGDKTEILGDPIEVALLQLANLSSTSFLKLKIPYKRINEIPFSSNTKMMGTLHKSDAGYFVAAKGSSEQLLEKCSQVQTNSTILELSDEARKKIFAQAEKMAEEGLRVLAFAYKDEKEISGKDYLNSLVFVGLIGFLDPPRLQVRQAILMCRRAGTKVVMVTGDHPLTALNIAKKVGLVDESEHRVITGTDIPPMESLSGEWKRRILSTAVIARTTPKQKLDIVSIYQQAGNIVAMTGDGINDAPALKKADVGIAMGIRGTQVAKETADIVLKDDSFESIERAIAQGRAIFDNIRKFVIYLVSCNLSEILIVTVLGFMAPAATLLPLQILFLNVVTDVFPALALGLGKGYKGVMERPPRHPGSLIVSKKNWITVYSFSFLITLSVIVAVIYCKQNITDDHRTLNNVAFITLAFAQIFHVFNMSSKHAGLLRNEITKNKFVWVAVVFCSSLLVLVYALPPLRLALSLEKLSVSLWAVSIMAGLISLVLVQIYKFVWRKRNKN